MSGNDEFRKVRKIKKTFTAEEKIKIIEEFIDSGLSGKAFAPKYDVCMETLLRWRREYRQNGTVKTTPTTKRGGPYNFELRLQAVQAYLKSGMSQKDFSTIWGVSEITLNRWNSLYKKYGAKGLEGSIFQDTFRKYKERHHKRISAKLEQEIIKTKTENPMFGLRKVKNFLNRFEGLKVSTGAIARVLKDENIPLVEVTKKRTRSSDRIRRFERAKSMQLWQTDITSYVLARNGTRVYLTVFLDDYSRYIVAWNLQLRQTSEFVLNCVLDGFQKFGKPEEILTDQGRQYFSWRGKSDFQKMLEKEGIKHVVARSHHPQTVGKCERLWETISHEFWTRARPQELSDARERLKHFINHYNHFRPHQGIDGMTPADRFFGVESEIRKILEDAIEKNALRLALDESPKAPVFLVGNIGGKSVSLHGEGGQLIFQSDDGILSKIGSNFNFGESNGRVTIKETKREEALKEDFANDDESSASDQTVVASSERGTEEIGPYERDNYVRILDGATNEDRSSESDECPDIATLADVSTGSEWNARGNVETEINSRERNEDESGRERYKGTEERDRGIEEYNCNAGSIDSNSTRDAWLSNSNIERQNSTEGEKQCGPKEDTKTSSNSGSEECSWKKEEERK